MSWPSIGCCVLVPVVCGVTIAGGPHFVSVTASTSMRMGPVTYLFARGSLREARARSL